MFAHFFVATQIVKQLSNVGHPEITNHMLHLTAKPPNPALKSAIVVQSFGDIGLYT